MTALGSHIAGGAAAAADRPALRGVLPLIAALAAAGGTVWLVMAANSASSYVGASLFAASLILLHGTSAVYHLTRWTRAARDIVKRIDHSMIFVLIAGTYTPLCLAISPAWGISILSVVWGLAGVGALAKVARPDLPRWLGVSVYVMLGWLGVVAVSEITHEFDAAPLVMLAVGGALYTLGGSVYAARRPDPWPRVFGYHEVFHGFVVGGSAVHFLVIALFVLPR